MAETESPQDVDATEVPEADVPEVPEGTIDVVFELDEDGDASFVLDGVRHKVREEHQANAENDSAFAILRPAGIEDREWLIEWNGILHHAFHQEVGSAKAAAGLVVDVLEEISGTEIMSRAFQDALETYKRRRDFTDHA